MKYNYFLYVILIAVLINDMKSCKRKATESYGSRRIEGPISGGSRIFERWFPLVVDHRRRGLGAVPPAAEEVLIFKNIQSIESYNILYLRPELATLVSVVS